MEPKSACALTALLMHDSSETSLIISPRSSVEQQQHEKNNDNDNNIISTSRSKRTIDTWLKTATEHQTIDVSMDESR